MKRAFTLIELLVVIAIIAILAAILFPVFAQAKLAAKKTVAISNAKQTGTAAIMYAGDSDDNFPSAYVPNVNDPAGSYYFDSDGSPSLAAYPANFMNAFGYDPQEDGQQFNNAVVPYTKSLPLSENPGMKELDAWIPVVYSTVKSPAPAKVNLFMNGFLHTYSASAVASPSVCPLVWQGFGTQQLRGGTLANPFLNCTGTGPCRYNPGGPVQAGMAGSFNSDMFSPIEGKGSHWAYGKTLIFVATDSSAKARNVGGNVSKTNAPAATFRFDPFRKYSTTGIGTSPYYCGDQSYECTFQPDREFGQ